MNRWLPQVGTSPDVLLAVWILTSTYLCVSSTSPHGCFISIWKLKYLKQTLPCQPALLPSLSISPLAGCPPAMLASLFFPEQAIHTPASGHLQFSFLLPRTSFFPSYLAPPSSPPGLYSSAQWGFPWTPSKTDLMTPPSPPLPHAPSLSLFSLWFLSLTYMLYILLQAWWASSAPNFNSVRLTEEAC